MLEILAECIIIYFSGTAALTLHGKSVIIILLETDDN